MNNIFLAFQKTCFFVFGVVTLFVGSMPASASDMLCGVEFNAMQFGFKLQPVHPDELSGCGRFLEGIEGTGPEKLVVSIVVIPEPAVLAMAKYPSNFVVKKDGSLKFKLPKRVSDSRNFYFVRPLKVLSEEVFQALDGVVYMAEYKREVHRLQKINDLEEQEVKELQRCVDAVRTTKSVTVVISGCDRIQRGSNLYGRVSNLLKTAKLPSWSITQ
jgi:hypothetical protein